MDIPYRIDSIEAINAAKQEVLLNLGKGYNLMLMAADKVHLHYPNAFCKARQSVKIMYTVTANRKSYWGLSNGVHHVRQREAAISYEWLINTAALFPVPFTFPCYHTVDCGLFFQGFLCCFLFYSLFHVYFGRSCFYKCAGGHCRLCYRRSGCRFVRTHRECPAVDGV